MWNIGWGVTNICNLNCEFCYSKKVRKETEGIPNLEEIKKFIDNNFDKVNSVNYGTGENTLSKDWIKIVEYVHNKFPNVTQGLTTNGYLSQICKDDALKKIIDDAIEEIDVSLDFGDPSRHGKFRGNPKTFDWVIETLEYGKKNNKRLTIVFIGTNETLQIENIKSIFSIAKKYDSKVRLNLYRPTIGINERTEKFIPDFDTIKNALIYISEHYKILSLSDPLFSTLFLKDKENIKRDPSGLDSIRILPDGSITPSTYLITDEFKKFNIKMENVLEKLKEKEFQNMIDRELPKECNVCKYKELCGGGVLDRRYLWYKDFLHKDPYCAFNNEEIDKIPKLKITKKDDFQSVHDGYLPTMFFSN